MSGGERESAIAAEQAIRLLAHTTRDGYGEPADLDAVLAELTALAGHLPQVLDRAMRWLATEVDAGRVGHDTYPAEEDVRTEVDGVITYLTRASSDAQRLHHSLDRARQVTASLHRKGGPS